MKPDIYFIAAAGSVIVAACLVVLTWIGTIWTISSQQSAYAGEVAAPLTDQATLCAAQIDRQIVAVEQTFKIVTGRWDAQPIRFDIETGRDQAASVNGHSRVMRLTNVNSIMRQWHINVAPALHHPDGSFAGVIDADDQIPAITNLFRQIDPGGGALVVLASLDEPKLWAAVDPTAIKPGARIGGTSMSTAMRKAGTGRVWTGPSPYDAVPRMHAFQHLPSRNLAVIVAVSEAQAMLPVPIWWHEANLVAGCISGVLAVLAMMLVQLSRLSRQKAALIIQNRVTLAASIAQFEVARALSAAKAEQLEVTLAGMSDGVAMIDGNMRLIEWNARFPEVAGVPAERLHAGLPMEEILHAQIRTGQFGWIADPEAEVARRMAQLREVPLTVTQRQRPDGHRLEMRHNRLADGGVVTFYSDIMEHKAAADALRRASAAAEAANSEKSKFVAMVSHEIRTPLNALLNSVRLLSDSVLAPAQRSLVAMAGQSGDALFGLINDVLDLSQMEAGKLSIRPSLFALRPLLESSAEMFTAQAAARGIGIRVTVAEGTAEMLLSDPGRLRQVLLNLLSNAVKYARPGSVWLTAEPGQNDLEEIRLCVKDAGPVIKPDARAGLFHPFSRLSRPEGDEPAGTGLGLSICHQLVSLLGGRIGYDAWRSDERHADNAQGQGNLFWIVLPAAALPFQAAPAGNDESRRDADQTSLGLTVSTIAHGEMPPRPLHRTRVLLTEDIPANQRVIAALLRREGHHVEIVASGEAAIQAVQATPFDLVFMDIFMPGMSGQEATQIIRMLPEPMRSIPVIALTANAGAADEARFRMTGMDGVLDKPVLLPELLAILDKHVWSPCRRCVGPVAAAIRGPQRGVLVPGTVPVLAIDRIRALRSNLPTEIFADLAEDCLIDMAHRLPALGRALAASSPETVAALAHALVGMAAGYGMAALEVRLRTVMAAAQDGSLLGPAVFAALESDFTEAARTLREHMRLEIG